MILDHDLLFSEDQAVTASTASTNVVDLGAVRDVGPGEPLEVIVQVTADFAGLSSLKARLQTAENENFSDAKDLVESDDVPVGDLKKGYQFSLGKVPHGTKRYLRMYYTVSGTGTAGTLTAGLALDRQTPVS